MNKPTPTNITIELENSQPIIIETGLLAKQAHGSAVVKQGNTVLLATVVSASESNPETDFMPLSVDYMEKFAAFGRFPGGFRKREGKPSEYEILVSRLVDRVLRPLFPKDYHSETFVNVELISADKNIMPDSLAGLAASTALMVSDIPFNGPISEVRVARVDGQFIINPSFEQLALSDIDIMVGATLDSIAMVEGEMNEISEQDMLEAIKFAHKAIKIQCQAQIDLVNKLGNPPKRQYTPEISDQQLENNLRNFCYDKLYNLAKQGNANKHQRQDNFEKVKQEFLETLQLSEQTPDKDKIEKLVDRYFHDTLKDAVRNLILDEGIRLDGRKTDQIRPIWCEVSYLPAPHGSAIFTRGETQSLSTVTLGSKMDEQTVDQVMVQESERFMLHYNFPPYSTGDAAAKKGLGRREIGHGNLAHRALKRMIPSEMECPYTIRVVSDILESNGSSSMATVCAGTLALMDAGVQIIRPVSGIAMGLITDTNTGKWAVLSDILGDEDHLGDMDFKVTGTTKGITACQMDIKIQGLSYEIMEKALQQANKGREHILNIMLETLPQPRPQYKPQVPKVAVLIIDEDQIGAVIGPGGKVIQAIQKETNSTIVIDQKDGKGIVNITAVDYQGLEAALAHINKIAAVPELGKVYKGKVKGIKEFGAFVEILPGKQGLLHISEISRTRVQDVSKVLKMGQEIEVKLIGIDEKNGNLKLSHKILEPEPDKIQKTTNEKNKK